MHAGDGAWRGHGLLLVGAFLWGLYTHAYRRSGLTPAQGAALIGAWSFLMLLPFGAMPLATAVANGLAGAVFVQAVLQGLISGVGSIILYGDRRHRQALKGVGQGGSRARHRVR
jgi:drug/metabolite transporter (DMT)-like permease